MSRQSDEIILRPKSNLKLTRKISGRLAKLAMRFLTGSKGALFAGAVLGFGYLAITKYGLPAFHFSYDYQSGFGAERYKTWCRYISVGGVYERAASGGRCSWVVLAPKEET